MLRLSKEDEKQVKEFHRLHEEAAKRGFGRLFRNPSLFEDVVKSLLLCGCRFQRSLEMAKGLCKLQKWLGKKCKWGNFPSAQELANLESEELLRNKCKLGYRAGLVMCLAKAVTDGEIKLLDYELNNMQLGDEESMFQKLKTIKGFGDFVTCNVLMCMGFYDRIPIDSETIRHIKQVLVFDKLQERVRERVEKETKRRKHLADDLSTSKEITSSSRREDLKPLFEDRLESSYFFFVSIAFSFDI
ncbi:DNA glycosylase [Cynara cardunculus var. scolymus]|uniref:DNA glycosylase n=1 Tax=Cynara cardunculus var. scolymus TaxID=59895 RepID=A0A103XD47_CYNCS|nr:DNA glycosylase [Cynara cardunculus var. scolymus]